MKKEMRLSNLCILMVKFMHPGPARSFSWPNSEDIYLVPVTNILSIIDPPKASTGRQYNLSKSDFKFIVS